MATTGSRYAGIWPSSSISGSGQQRDLSEEFADRKMVQDGSPLIGQLRTRRPKSNGQRDHVVPTPAVV